jgi:hypothetical protein
VNVLLVRDGGAVGRGVGGAEALEAGCAHKQPAIVEGRLEARAAHIALDAIRVARPAEVRIGETVWTCLAPDGKERSEL